MARYKMDDETIIDTKNATHSWQEERDHDGRNFHGRSSGSQWHDQTLYRSRRGRYYIEHISRVQGTLDRAEWIDNHAAARWLMLNEHELPEELKPLEAEISE